MRLSSVSRLSKGLHCCLVVVSLMLSFCFSFVLAQNSYVPRVAPLTPNAAAFSKYGDYTVNSITGRPNISIPVYTLSIGTLKVPISLTNGGSAIKVNELATWVGLGWSLNVGGTISRTVRGLPDETQSSGYFDDPATADDIINMYGNRPAYREYADLIKDAAPDFFSYNIPGKAGRFVYRKSIQAFKSIPDEPVQISRSVDHVNANNDNLYTITDENGNRYLFEQKQLFVDDNELQVTAPLRSYNQSWHLTRIISANKVDTIYFSYAYVQKSAVISPGVTVDAQWQIQKGFSKVYSLAYGAVNYAAQEVTQNDQSITTAEPLLREITFRGGKIVLHAETARKDYPSAMLDSISVFAKSVVDGSYTVAQRFVFNYDYFTSNTPVNQYNYRLKLVSFAQIDVKNRTNSATYSFEYNPTKLPVTHSTAQDYWGYYNGALENNLLPNVPPTNGELLPMYASTPIGGADRKASDAYTQACMLQKITYPTGGYSLFTYEPNKYKTEQTSTTTTTGVQYSYSLAGKGKNSVATSTQSFVWGTDMYSNNGTFEIVFSANTNPGAADTPQRLTLKDATSNTQIAQWEHINNNTTPLTISYGYFFTVGHIYQVIMVIDDVAATTISVQVTGTKRVTNTTLLYPSGAGVRIKEIAAYAASNELSTREVYTYNGTEGEGISTLLRSDKDYNQNFYTRVSWVKDENCGNVVPCACAYRKQTDIIYVAQSSFASVNFEGAPAIYNEATKVIYGKNGGINGKVVYSQIANTALVNRFNNPNTPGGWEYYNNMIDGGRLPDEKVYAYDVNTAAYTPVKEKKYVYEVYNSGNEKEVNVARVIYFPTDCGDIEGQAVMSDFQYMDYWLQLGCYKLMQTIDRDYTADGNSIERITSYTYNNTVHMQPTSISTKGSDNMVLITTNKYAGDFTDNTYGSNWLREAGVANVVLEQTSLKNNQPVQKVITGYRQDQLHPVVDYIKEGMRGAEPETKAKFYSYDAMANIQALSKYEGSSADVKEVYLWGVWKTAPVARVINADISNVFCNSFEEGNGNGTLNDAKTGHWSFSGNYSVSLTGLLNGAYILSYARKNAGAWEWISGNVIVTGNAYTIAVSGQVDDIRFYPANAQMTTYTYEPLIGVTSETDASGRTSYYEYDGMGRLIQVRDLNGNILKRLNYSYNSQ